MSFQYTRTLYCAHADYYKVKSTYPRRTVVPDVLVNAGYIYFSNVKGQTRMIDLKTKEVYGCDYDKGFPYMKRLR